MIMSARFYFVQCASTKDLVKNTILCKNNAISHYVVCSRKPCRVARNNDEADDSIMLRIKDTHDDSRTQIRNSVGVTGKITF